MAHKAVKGGEIGANGEYYKGGQFVADSPNTVKSHSTSSKTNKIEIEPYHWIPQVKDEKSIMTSLLGILALYTDKSYSTLTLVDNAEFLCTRNHWNFQKAKEMVQAYNSGSRTYTGSGFYIL